MAFFIPISSAPFTFTHHPQIVANFYSHTDPSVHPFTQPIELRQSINEEEWQTRTVAIWNHLARYTWSKFLRLYLIMSFVLSLIGPISANLVVNRIIFNGTEPLGFNATDDEIRERISLIRKGHLINFIVICFIFLLIWVPYLSYKAMGRKRLAALLRSFTQLDAAKGNVQALSWTCSRTSTFQANATIVIELPVAFISSHQPSIFHQSAYLPAYVQKESSPAALPTYTHQVGQNDANLLPK